MKWLMYMLETLLCSSAKTSRDLKFCETSPTHTLIFKCMKEHKQIYQIKLNSREGQTSDEECKQRDQESLSFKTQFDYPQVWTSYRLSGSDFY